MDRDHKIRVIVRGLRGQTREKAILKLLSHPDTINFRLFLSLQRLRKRLAGRSDEWDLSEV